MRYIKKTTISLIVILSMVSCEGELDIANPNELSSQEYYSNSTQAVAAVDAIYNPLITSGMYQRHIPIYNDGRSDELFVRGPWGFMITFSNFTMPPTLPAHEAPWAQSYTVVLRANQAIENVPNIDGLDVELRNRLIGQALFLRALAYFNLANIFENPPIVLSVPEDQSQFYPSNSDVTKQMVYDQVEVDLTEAISLLPLNYDNVSGPDQGQTGRVTRGAANALMGRLLLYQGRYSESSTFLGNVISSGEYSLAANYQDIFSGDNSLEQADPGKIFWVEFTNSQNPVLNWAGEPNVNWRQFNGLTPTYSVTNFFDFKPTQFLYNEMRSELTVDGTLDPRYHATIASNDVAEGDTIAWGQPWISGNGFPPDEFYIAKYTYANLGGGDALTAGFNYPVLRYADVLLMQAECLANANNMPQAASLVQQVRDRAKLPDRESEFAGYNLEQFMDQLAHERIMELAIEGHRWYDIMRWGWLDNSERLDQLRLNDKEFETFVPDRKIMPIPQSELDRNVNLVGNALN